MIVFLLEPRDPVVAPGTTGQFVVVDVMIMMSCRKADFDGSRTKWWCKIGIESSQLRSDCSGYSGRLLLLWLLDTSSAGCVFAIGRGSR